MQPLCREGERHRRQRQECSSQEQVCLRHLVDAITRECGRDAQRSVSVWAAGLGSCREKPSLSSHHLLFRAVEPMPMSDDAWSFGGWAFGGFRALSVKQPRHHLRFGGKGVEEEGGFGFLPLPFPTISGFAD